jgi:hypothetical protein
MAYFCPHNKIRLTDAEKDESIVLVPILQNFLREFCNKLVCLSLASLSSLVYCLWERPGAYTRVEYLKGASLG